MYIFHRKLHLRPCKRQSPCIELGRVSRVLDSKAFGTKMLTVNSRARDFHLKKYIYD